VFKFITAKLPRKIRSLLGASERTSPARPTYAPAFERRAAKDSAPARGLAAAPPIPIRPPSAALSKNPDTMGLPLATVLEGLPAELRQRVRSRTDGLTVSFLIETISPQLARGIVKVSFGELRQAAPGVFSEATDKDEVLVQLPLAEILARIDHKLLKHRRAFGRIEISDDIPAPFDPGCDASADENQNHPRALAEASPASRAGNSGAWVEIPPTKTEVSTSAPPPGAQPTPTPPAPPVAAPARSGKIGKTPPASVDPKALVLELASIWDGWPEALRRELFQSGLGKAKLALHPGTIADGMKRGQIAFKWKALREWLEPPLTAVSVHDHVKVVLPLEKIAPMFLAKNRKAARKSEIKVDESIPALFSVPEAQPAVQQPKDAVENSSRAPASAAAPEADEVSPEKQPKAAAANTQAATPDVIVFRATALNGISGALIVLPEGLKVASRLPRGIDPDTVAAFIPQIFNATRAAAANLNRGEMDRLVFYLNGVPWIFFRLDGAFFAAIGHPNTPFPEKELAALAAEVENTK
jgi:predicted regulator of Ras-like GTPase activity (Roadblock/LC7/MglB family)